jgi:hypothetical protein
VNSWHRTSDWGILRAGSADAPDAAWHAARLSDVLRVGGVASGPLVVSSIQSGVWIVNEMGGPAIPLSWEWPSLGIWGARIPAVTCLAQGTHSPDHVYAGGAALAETDTTQPAPLFHWRDIPLLDANHNPLGRINRMVVVRELQKLVLACDNGVFWATIPPPGGTYLFNPAGGLPGQRFSGLAEGPVNTVIAGAWGTDLKNHFGIFVGTWGSALGPLTFAPASIAGIKPALMRRTDLAACAGDRTKLYAVCGGGNPTTPATDSAGNILYDKFGNVTWANDNDFILAVLVSGDGGLTWGPTSATVTGDPRPLFPGNVGSDVAGHTQDGYVGCIGVSPVDSRQVAVGMGEPLLSTDGGASWTAFTELSGPGFAHRHTDTHALLFDPSAPKTLYIGSDGGLATTPDLGATWQTATNRQLPNHEFYKVTASPKDAGLVAGSLQDNGNLEAPLYITVDPWKTLDDGDGVMTQFVSTGDLLRQNNTATDIDPSGATVEYGRKVRAATWDPVGRQFQDRQMFPTPPLSEGVIPVDGTGDGLAVPANQDGLELTEPIAIPGYSNAQAEPMVAVGASGRGVFGLFGQANGNSHWTPLATVPNLPSKDAKGNPLPYFISAVTSPDGKLIFAGTNNGRVFRLLSPNFTVTDVSDAAVSVPVIRIVAFATDRAFLIAGTGVFRLSVSAAGGATWTKLTGKVLPGGASALLPTADQFNALAADSTTVPPTLYVCTAFGIFVSADEGDAWLPFVDGLPNAPLCTDLRWVEESSGVTFLYLATQGWSAFRRPLNVQEGTFSTVVVDGQMELIDQVLFGNLVGDDTTFVWFNDSRVLGPFHPIDSLTFSGKEKLGGEIQAKITLNLAWKVDSSVVVTWNADMQGDDENDGADGKVTVATGTTQPVEAHLATDTSWWEEPDRVNISLTVTN